MPRDASSPPVSLTLSVRQRGLIVDLGLVPPKIPAKIRFAVPRHGGDPDLDRFRGMVRWRFFWPLAAFGLVEFDCEGDDLLVAPLSARMRKTPLFDAFLTFNLPDTGAQE